MSKKLFIVGTGTDVGKTYVTALIVKKIKEAGYSSAYYKAAMSGNDRGEDGIIPGDAVFVKQCSGITQALSEMSPYLYEKPLSPHLAAKREGNPIRLERVMEGLKKLNHYDYITMEGLGGILCPLSYDDEELWLEDVIRESEVGCLLVADAGLGTINAVGLSAFYMKEKGIPLKGIIFNRFEEDNLMHKDNLKMVEELTGVKVIARVKEADVELDLRAESLLALYEGEKK